jgi:hypothetical protein
MKSGAERGAFQNLAEVWQRILRSTVGMVERVNYVQAGEDTRPPSAR